MSKNAFVCDVKKWFIDFINVTTNIFRWGTILSHYVLLPPYSSLS